MVKLLLGVLFALLVFLLAYCIFWIVKFNNPFTFTMVFGKKGSGKSTFFTKEALRLSKRGWTVYSDSPMNIEGVRLFDPRDLGECLPPPKSVIFIDEGGLIYNNRNFKNFKQSWLEFYKLQRHAKCKVYVGSQTFDIDLKLRDLTDSMYICRKYLGVLVVLGKIDKYPTVINTTENGTGGVADQYELESPLLALFGSRKFVWIPRWYKLHDSYSLPVRPLLDYTEINFSPKESSVAEQEFQPPCLENVPLESTSSVNAETESEEDAPPSETQITGLDIYKSYP